jgi:hypothetical protein
MMSAVMSLERRRADRFQTDLEARWEGVLTRREAKVVDLSATGCFLLTADEVMRSELIRIEILSPEGPWVYLWGEVVYQVSEMGFAVRFTGATDDEQATLKDLLAYLSARRGAKS